MSKHNNNKIRSNQEGIVAIIVAVILTVLMSLIILAISQNANREQRQALDRQLSDQAFYNAESGVNDLANYLYKNIATVPAIPVDKKTCLPEIPLPPPGYTLNDPSGTNKYTCLLYDKAPPTLQYNGVSLSSPKVIPVKPVSGLNVSSLTFSWDDTADRNAPIIGPCDFAGGSPILPDQCGHGGLRVEVAIPAPSRTAIQRASIIAFLLPTNTPGTPDISVPTLLDPDNQGIISPTTCADPPPADTRRCTKTITGMNNSTVFLSLRSLYRPVNLTITGKDTSNADIRFQDAQIIVDSTARASDILRRIQVRIPATSQYSYPGFALQSKDSICKLLVVTQNDDGTGRAEPIVSGDCPAN